MARTGTPSGRVGDTLSRSNWPRRGSLQCQTEGSSASARSAARARRCRRTPRRRRRRWHARERG
eukprot:2217719-Prymnesium_polylepis.1